ncbi:hypothetical protein DFH08DRAFT_955569 [Mycena albidolilacea]|uniref:Glycosyltransferase subfamily 4-like N-terminal domain-containing protein n=1 Tax=Mycena albidolilacea TaxID=1033008 RepID=A0AAD7AB84_9AGAR|nr:hypothetical protein DFH08DRAFT_955569 [Mycena albidolilacea]
MNQYSLPLHNEALRVAIIAENFLPKIDGSTITIAHPLQHLTSTGVHALLLGPESGISTSSPPPSCVRAFSPHVIHLVDPIWLGVQALAAITIRFPTTSIVTSHHTNLPTYAEVFGYPYYHWRTWGVHRWLHSFARSTLVPSRSTAQPLREKGFANLRVVGRGVDEALFHLPPIHSPLSARSCYARNGVPAPTTSLSIGRLSPEKNLELLVHAYAALVSSPTTYRPKIKTHLVSIGTGPFLLALRHICAALGVHAVFAGHLSGRALGEAVASGDIVCFPSITETFGQVTLQGMAAGLPVVGLYVEGTADLVQRGRTGLLLDPLSATDAPHAAGLDDTKSSSSSAWSLPLPSLSPHDSAVSEAVPSLNSPSRTKHNAEDPVPDSGVCFAPIDTEPGAAFGLLPPLELPPPIQEPQPSRWQNDDDGDDDPFASPPDLALPHSSADPSSNANAIAGTADAPPVGSFHTLAPLMRAARPSLSRGNGQARACTLDALSLGGVQPAHGGRAYVDACRPTSPSLGSGSSSSNLQHPGTSNATDDKTPLLGASSSNPDSNANLTNLTPAGERTIVDGLGNEAAWLVDALVVLYALVAATLSHAIYMVPAGADLWVWR